MNKNTGILSRRFEVLNYQHFGRHKKRFRVHDPCKCANNIKPKRRFTQNLSFRVHETAKLKTEIICKPFCFNFLAPPTQMYETQETRNSNTAPRILQTPTPAKSAKK